MRSTKELRGVRVLGGKRGKRRIGKILRAVFHPTTFNLVGYLVKRPDFLFMVKRSDRFLAYDAFKIVDGRIVATIDRDSWGEPACKRLGIDWDTCLILEGMSLVTRDGKELGFVGEVEYDERSGETKSVISSNGRTAKALLGNVAIPRELLVKYHDGAVVVENEASSIELGGGLAAKAGEGVAIASNKIAEVGAEAGKVVSKAGKSAGKVINKGAYSLGKQISKSTGMFAAFKEEYDKEAKRDSKKS